MGRKCAERCEVYSRVVGYFRPVSQWNNGKRQEFKDRTPFAVPGEERRDEVPAEGVQEVAEAPKQDGCGVEETEPQEKKGE